MTFRDDHDAALARGDALQRDLESAKETVEEKTEALEKANADKARLEAELAELRAKQPLEPAPPDSSSPGAPDQTQPKSSFGVSLGIGVLLLLVVIGLALSRDSKQQKSPPNPTCTLVTEPPGATIFAIRRDRVMEELNRKSNSETMPSMPSTYESRLGVTPISKARLEWIAEGVTMDPAFEARLDGYRPLSVSLPLEGLGCSEMVYRLERQ